MPVAVESVEPMRIAQECIQVLNARARSKGQTVGIKKAELQMLVICITVELGPKKPQLSCDFDEQGYFTGLLQHLDKLTDDSSVRRDTLKILLEHFVRQFALDISTIEASTVAA